MEIFTLILFTFLYFIPSIVAYTNEKKNEGAIFILNIFLGWTILGWIIALIWAFMKERKKFWLFPIIVVLVLLGSLIVFTQGSAVAPFIYTLF